MKSGMELDQGVFKEKSLNARLSIFKNTIKLLSVIMFIGLVGLIFHNVRAGISISEEISPQIVSVPIAATVSKKSKIVIPTGTVNANPFLPYREITKTVDGVYNTPVKDLSLPPKAVDATSDAARVMDTIVSGILYDKINPSAILNIEGSDYLVKKGDSINNYKILNIAQDNVTVQLGSNVYRAGIGEVLTEGELNYNNVSNLKSKFGGVR